MAPHFYAVPLASSLAYTNTYPGSNNETFHIFPDIYHFMSNQQQLRDESNGENRGLPSGGVDLDVGSGSGVDATKKSNVVRRVECAAVDFTCRTRSQSER